MTGPQPIDYSAIAPPLVVAAGALLVLLLDLVLGPRRQRGVDAVPAVALVVVVAAALLLWPLRHGTRQTFCVPQACSYVADPLAVVVQLVVLVGAAVVLLMSMTERGLPVGEYSFLVLSSVTGALVVAAARDLATLLVALEVVSLPSFALVALRRDAASAQGALTAFLMSIVATAVSLLGIAFVYSGTGTVHLQRLSGVLADPAVRQPVVLAGVVLAFAAPLFKLAAVPFHGWAPDTYRGAPLSVAAYLSLVSKGAGVVAVISLGLGGFASAESTWAPIVALVAAATMLLGNLGALRQSGVVRLLAWSSIGQAGYILVPLASVGGVDPAVAVSAAVAYLAAYGAMNLGAFAVVAAAAPQGVSPGAVSLTDFRGLARSRPFLGLSLAFFLACLAGLPPGLLGLFAKVRVFDLPVTAGLGWLAVVMGVATVIGLAYYVGFAVLLFAEPDRAAAGSTVRTASAPAAGPAYGAVALLLAVTVATSVAPVLVLGLLAP